MFDDHVSEDMCMEETPDIVSGDEMRSFTISWGHGQIQAFVKGEPTPFLSWTDPNPITVSPLIRNRLLRNTLVIQYTE